MDKLCGLAAEVLEEIWNETGSFSDAQLALYEAITPKPAAPTKPAVHISPENYWREVWHDYCPASKMQGIMKRGTETLTIEDGSTLSLYECLSCGVKVFAGLNAQRIVTVREVPAVDTDPDTEARAKAQQWIDARPSDHNCIDVNAYTGECEYAFSTMQLPFQHGRLGAWTLYAPTDPQALAAVVKWQKGQEQRGGNDG